MAQIDPPTFTVQWTGNQAYTAPSGWDRHAPCTCNDCPPCDTWLHLEMREPSRLTFSDYGNCYIGTGSQAVLPPVETITGPFCVSLQAVDSYVIATPFEEGGKIYIDGVAYVGAAVSHNLGIMCICYDGEKFVATGDATPVYFGPPPQT